jgi:8-oxo-dGTP diphosphatase
MLGPLSLLPSQAYGLLHEVARHVLRRPVVGVVAVPFAPDGRILLIRRADTGMWAMPGGTLEWGETLLGTIKREVEEEAGARVTHVRRVTGVYSRPDRDPRFHAVTICVLADIDGSVRGPKNALEIREARLFERGDIPSPLSMQLDDMLAHALAGGEAVLE